MEKRKVGSVEVIALIDNVMPYAATDVYTEAGDALGAYRGFLDSEGRVPLNFACFLLVDGGRRVLVDTGWGPEFGGKLPEELAAAGVALADIDTVIFTHLHGDHTGWNMDRASGAPLFPKARYLVPRADWEHYGSQSPRPESFVRDVKPLDVKELMDLVDGETQISPSLTAVATPGHTPGHTSVVVSSGGERGYILGDIVLSPIDAEELSWTNSFDWDHSIARETRIRVVNRLVGDGSLVGGSHLPVPGFGRFVRDGQRTRWQAG